MRKRRRPSKKKNIKAGTALCYTYMLFLLSVIIIFIWSFIDNFIPDDNTSVPLTTVGSIDIIDVPQDRARVSVQNGCDTNKLAWKYRRYLMKNHRQSFDFYESINVPDGARYKNTTILFNSGYKEQALALGQSILMINPEYIRAENSAHGPGIGPDITLILGLDYISLDSHKLFAQDESFQPK